MEKILVDTSVWVQHFRAGNQHLEDLLQEGQVVTHSFIIGELACGNIKNRAEILSLLQSLPITPNLSPEEFLFFIEHHQLMGTGLGFVDVHLLASAKFADTPLWTLDKKLNSASHTLGIRYR